MHVQWEVLKCFSNGQAHRHLLACSLWSYVHPVGCDANLALALVAPSFGKHGNVGTVQLLHLQLMNI
jgi:hypothetical protein